MKRLAMETDNITDKNIQKILELFPNVATESRDENGNLKTAIDFEKLKQELSENIVDSQEKYEFTWVGKKEAMLEANRPIRKTLRPDRESSVNWDTTENIYIEGDNLDALKLLQESYMGKIKMIYIDPPYNTGKDFVYRDNRYKTIKENDEDLQYKNEDDEINFSKQNELFLNTESNNRFHSDWCSMIYPRLKLARNLLSDDGVIFISIGEQEVFTLKTICNEIFSESNYIETYIWESTFRPDNSSTLMRRNGEYIICIAKSKEYIKRFIGITKEKEGLPSLTKSNMKESILRFPSNTVKTFLQDGIYHKGTKKSYELLNDVKVKNGIILNEFSLKGHMIWGQTNLINEINNGTEIIIKSEDFVPYTKKAGDCMMAPTKIIPREIVGDILSANAEMNELFEKKVFSYPKPVSLLKYLINYIDDDNFIVLDFFSGSSTTAQAVFALNAETNKTNKFVMIQLNENLIEHYKQASDKEKVIIKNAIELCENLDLKKSITSIAEERIRRAGKKIQEENPDKKIDIGFRVFKVDDTNMKDVYYTPNETDQKQLEIFESNIKDDRTDEDLLYGCLLDWGVELSLPHKVEVIDGKRVHIINEQEGFEPDLIACFEDSIPESVIRKIAEKKPTRVVFRDSSFVSDDNKINVEEIFKLITPETKVKVI